MFDSATIEYPETGVISAPEDVPDDVVLHLEFAEFDLTAWIDVVSWMNGVPTTGFPDEITIENGFVTDTYRGVNGRGFWRYRAELVP